MLYGNCFSPEGFRGSQSGAAETSATQTGSPKGEDRGSDRIKRLTIVNLHDSRAINFKRANARGLPQDRFMNITKNLGMLLLAIYLIIVGIVALFHIGIPVIVTGILALAAGILILIG